MIGQYLGGTTQILELGPVTQICLKYGQYLVVKRDSEASTLSVRVHTYADLKTYLVLLVLAWNSPSDSRRTSRSDWATQSGNSSS